MDTDSLDTEGIRSFPEGSASGLDLVLAVIGGRVFFADSHYDDNGATVFSTALDGSDERELWSTVRSLPTYAFTEDAIWCAAGGADDPAIERFDLASLAAETLLDSSSGLTSVNRIVAIDDAIYFDAGLNGQPGIFKLEAGGEPVHVSSNHLLGATGGYLYAYGSPGERSLDVNYTFTRIDLATNEEVPFDYPEPYNTHNSSFQFYGFDSRLLINVGDRAYVVSPRAKPSSSTPSPPKDRAAQHRGSRPPAGTCYPRCPRAAAYAASRSASMRTVPSRRARPVFARRTVPCTP